MAPFPSKRSNSTTPTLLPTHTSYPPLPPSAAPSRVSSPSPLAAVNDYATTDRAVLFGRMVLPAPGIAGGVLGGGSEARQVVRELLQDNHVNHHTFTNDKGFHNHLSHHVLAAYALGAGPNLLKDIYELDRPDVMPMPPLQPITITEKNWTEYLGDGRLYPNFLAFFHRLIAATPTGQYTGRRSSVVPVIEKYLLGGEGEMLIRSVSGAIHPFIHIGHGVEFNLDALVAEGLAQCAVHSPSVSELFDSPWPAPSQPPSMLQSTFSTAFSALKLGGLGLLPIASNDSFIKTCAGLDRTTRSPREGLGGFTILDRILHDPELAPGRTGSIDDTPRLGKTLELRGERIKAWCEEWKFSVDSSEEYEGRREKGARVPGWEEIVEKCEELIWIATVIYASSTRPGYVDVKLDFFLMHALTSVLFLPSILEVVSPHLRPALLHSHFRIMIGYWVSRGRPNLFINETLMASTAFPRPPSSSSSSGAIHAKVLARSIPTIIEPDSATTPTGNDGEEKRGMMLEGESEVNPWGAMLSSACDHSDDHLPKVIRALAFAATNFGHSPVGFYTSSLPGTSTMDGSIFVRAAGLTFRAMGWEHSGEPSGSWDRSVLGYPSSWSSSALLAPSPHRPIARRNGKSRQADSETIELTPSSPSIGSESGRSGAPVMIRHAEVERESKEEREERVRREEEEEEERGLMA